MMIAYQQRRLQQVASVLYNQVTMDMTQEIERIKKELVTLITAHLKANQMDVPTAQKLASAFLSILPIKDQKDLLTKLKELGDNYVEIRGLYLEELTKVTEWEREHALTQMRNAIAQGNIEHAIAVAKAVKGAS